MSVRFTPHLPAAVPQSIHAMNYKLIELNGDHQVIMLETEDLEQARSKYVEVVDACKDGTYDFYCAFADLKDALTIVLEGEDHKVVMAETFH